MDYGKIQKRRLVVWLIGGLFLLHLLVVQHWPASPVVHMILILPIALAGEIFGLTGGLIAALYASIQVFGLVLLLGSKAIMAQSPTTLLFVVLLLLLTGALSGVFGEILQNKIRELAHSTTRQTVLMKVMSALTHAHDLSELFDQTVEILKQICKYRYPTLWEYDEETQDLILVAPSDAKASRVHVGEGIVGEAAKTHQPVLVNDLAPSSYPPPTVSEAKAGLAYPILRDGQVFGVLAVESEHPNVFQEEDLQILGAIAEFLGVLMERERLLSRLDQKGENLANFYAAVIRLMATPRHGDVIEPCLQDVASFPDVIGVRLWLAEGHYLYEKDSLVKPPWSLPTQIGPLLGAKQGPTYLFAQDLFMDIIRTSHDPIILSEVELQTTDVPWGYILEQVHQHEQEIRSLGFFPLQSSEGFLGVMMVASRRPVFLADRIHILTIFTRALSILMASRSDAKKLEFFDRTARLALENPKESVVLARAIQQLGTIIRFDHALLIRTPDAHGTGEFILSLHEGPNLVFKVRERISLEKSGLIRVVDTREPVVFADLTDPAPAAPLRDRYLKIGIRSLVYLPLYFQNQILAILAVGRKLPDAFSDAEVAGLQEISDFLAVILHNIWLQERLQQESITDPLTGLRNRKYLVQRGKEEIARSQRTGEAFSILLIDLTDFKRINDTYGHLFGDEVLSEVALRIQKVIRSGDIAARYGGDEFVILLPNTPYEAAGKAAERLIRVIEEPMEIRGETITVKANIGIATFPQDGTDFYTLVDLADNRMYQAKIQGVPLILEEKG